MACHNGVRVVPPACGRARGGGARVWCGRMWWAGVWWRMWWRAPARGGGRVAGARVWRSIRHHIIAPRGRACAGFPRILFSRPHVVADSRARNRRKSSAHKRLGRFHHHEPPALCGRCSCSRPHVRALEIGPHDSGRAVSACVVVSRPYRPHPHIIYTRLVCVVSRPPHAPRTPRTHTRPHNRMRECGRAGGAGESARNRPAR